jgi:hypothetical protein
MILPRSIQIVAYIVTIAISIGKCQTDLLISKPAQPIDYPLKSSLQKSLYTLARHATFLFVAQYCWEWFYIVKEYAYHWGWLGHNFGHDKVHESSLQPEKQTNWIYLKLFLASIRENEQLEKLCSSYALWHWEWLSVIILGGPTQLVGMHLFACAPRLGTTCPCTTIVYNWPLWMFFASAPNVRVQSCGQYHWWTSKMSNLCAPIFLF